MNANLYPLPTPKPGHRFAPAKVGATNDASVIVLIECPTWCAEDHVDEPVRHVEDIMHRSGAEGFLVHSFIRERRTHELFAYVEADPVAENPLMRDAHVVVEDGGNEFGYLTADMAEQLADKIVGFASHLRHLARTARLANQTAAGPDPDMDEALRRVREGRTA
ncbi:DUF6907 domain-containing protein [Streptomyces europaeiscabiei]|uniref:DUF6907 domain-containing protein n=1 Tax=Streptomyces europaeiscabiei TaxID=146819 RepID=UPI0029B5217F|nr:hypothetical protein [Streptomyces europaeiscabiei]MDX3582006.1 hypothetical protein [Streptomyces europaeiscabiei]